MSNWKDWAKTGAKYFVNPLLAVPDTVKYAKEAVKASGIGPAPSAQEQADLAQQRTFRDQMLAAAQNRMANPLQAPQLGRPAWMVPAGSAPPLGPGTQSVGPDGPILPPGLGAAPTASPGPAFSGGPDASQGGPPATYDNGVSPAIVEQLKRIRAQKFMDSLKGIF